MPGTKRNKDRVSRARDYLFSPSPGSRLMSFHATWAAAWWSFTADPRGRLRHRGRGPGTGTGRIVRRVAIRVKADLRMNCRWLIA